MPVREHIFDHLDKRSRIEKYRQRVGVTSKRTDNFYFRNNYDMNLTGSNGNVIEIKSDLAELVELRNEGSMPAFVRVGIVKNGLTYIALYDPAGVQVERRVNFDDYQSLSVGRNRHKIVLPIDLLKGAKIIPGSKVKLAGEFDRIGIFSLNEWEQHSKLYSEAVKKV